MLNKRIEEGISASSKLIRKENTHTHTHTPFSLPKSLLTLILFCLWENSLISVIFLSHSPPPSLVKEHKESKNFRSKKDSRFYVFMN